MTNKGEIEAAMYDLGRKKPLVNLKYLIDLMECVPNYRIYIDPDKKEKSQLYFCNDEGFEAVLVPIQKSAYHD